MYLCIYVFMQTAANHTKSRRTTDNPSFGDADTDKSDWEKVNHADSFYIYACKDTRGNDMSNIVSVIND